jgi:serine phosphatase RsbU (regulator of sigma subunit)
VAAQAATEPVRVDDLEQWAPNEASQRTYGVLADGRLTRSWLGIPVRSREGRLFGVLLATSGWVRAFDESRQRLAVGLGSCLGAILTNRHLLAEREAATHALAHTLLPPLLPHIPGLELGARYRATGAGNLVGGDFYDVFPSVPGHWDVLLGDVSGFGPEAAAITGIARYTVRAVAKEMEGPAQVLESLNRAMFGRVPDERFCTAVILRLRCHSDGVEVTIASGGHPPALILRDDGGVETAEGATGMLLGVAPDPGLVEERMHLCPGDSLVLYTDGVTEARGRRGELFGTEALTDLLVASAGRTADGLARRVELAVVDHQGGRTGDDMAVVVLRAAPRPHPA